jgi:hypothetical protein
MESVTREIKGFVRDALERRGVVQEIRLLSLI